MKTKFVSILLLSLLLLQCKLQKNQPHFIDGGKLRVEGTFENDSLYNGKMKFYDNASGKLLYECEYKKGILNGERMDYFNNGVVSSKVLYENNKLNGYVYLYDTLGSLLSKQFYFHDLIVGPRITFEDKKVKKYSFYSLDNNPLISITYDESKRKKINNMGLGYFYFYKDSSFEVGTNQINEKLKYNYFLYTPNPPEYKFRYSLVVIGDDNKILSTVEAFDTTKQWATFEIKSTDNKKYALQLILSDSIADGELYMLKELK